MRALFSLGEVDSGPPEFSICVSESAGDTEGEVLMLVLVQLSQQRELSSNMR